MAPQYKLTYFNVRAVAEPIRLLLAHAKIEYEDDRVEGSDWPALKPTTPWGKLPLLEEGDFKLSQSLAILKYLGTKHGYVGESLQETARIDELIGAFNDLRDVYFLFRREEDEEKKAEKERKLKEEAVPFYLGKFDSVLEKNGKYFVGDKISIIDFYIGAHLQTMDQILGGVLDTYISLKEHQTTVLCSPGVKEWVERRPVTQF
jgi:glutathione S-transferase